MAFTLPHSRRRTALEAIADRLRRADEFETLDVLWRIDDGAPTGDDPLPEGRNAVRLTPEIGTSEPFAACGWGRVLVRCAWRVRVEVSPADGRWASAADLWDAIERTLAARGEQPADVLATLGALQSAGVDDLEVTQPADPAQAGYLDITTYVEG